MNNNFGLHLGIAEKGKLYAVEGNHQEALRHYKEAIKMTENQPNGSVFFQHYMQCVMESLEQMGAHSEVMGYCEKFLAMLDEQNLEPSLEKKYRADVLQRWAIQYLLLGEKEEAKELLCVIQTLVGRGTLKLADELLGWLQRGYTVGVKQIQELQKKYQYFIVSRDKLRPDLAISLPEIINHF